MRTGGKWSLFVGFLGAMLFTIACQTQPHQIFIEADGRRQALTTEATTVREALAEAKVNLGPVDRVKPDLYTRLEPGLVIEVIRVREEIEVKREVIPFERQTVTNEALASGETRLAQLGVNGEDEISIRIVYENGVEVSRTEISRRTVIEPIPEILVLGPQDELPSVPIEGTIAYIANGNAWLMRGSSGSRRGLTTEANLDGRVFSLSPDGRQILYTTPLTDEIDLPLNEIWLASTTIVGEQPITLGIRGVVGAEWSPVISRSVVAYTTAERVANPPGWQANNDLWLLDLQKPNPKPVQLAPPGTQGLYSWWGTTFHWSPQGERLAYARADQVGIIDLSTSKSLTYTLTTLVDFPPLKTFSEWAWVPGLSWSPDGEFIAATIHGPPVASEPVDESQVFDLWLMSIDNLVSVKVADQVGMWANPAWGEAGIAFGQAVNPLQSVNSRYTIQLIDRDGSNQRQLFPFQEEPGVQLPELVWSATGDQLLFTYNGNLYLASGQGGPPKQLTADGQASHPRWVSKTPVISSTPPLTATKSLSPTLPITGTEGTITDQNTIEISSTPAVKETMKPTVMLTRSAPGRVTTTPSITPTGLPRPTMSPSPETNPEIQATMTVTNPLPSN